MTCKILNIADHQDWTQLFRVTVNFKGYVTEYRAISKEHFDPTGHYIYEYLDTKDFIKISLLIEDLKDGAQKKIKFRSVRNGKIHFIVSDVRRAADAVILIEREVPENEWNLFEEEMIEPFPEGSGYCSNLRVLTGTKGVE